MDESIRNPPNAVAGGAEEAGAMSAVVIGANTLAFAIGFAIWVIFGPSIRTIAKELAISQGTATWIKTLPVLIGSVMRIPVGIVTDRFGAKLTFPALLCISAAALYGLSEATSVTGLLLNAAVMGLIGTTFVVGVQSVSSWTPPARRGFALGIFGAGNVGTALTTLGLPLLLVSLGWRGSFRLCAAIAAVCALIYALVIHDRARAAATLHAAALLAPLKNARAWRFGFYYLATFGVFVAATLTINDVYVDGYHMPLKAAGMLATTFTATASLCRIPGGRLADRFGARVITRWALVGIGVTLTPVCVGLPLGLTVALIFAAGVSMGFGMAAVFRYIPDYFPGTVGAVGGVVGALGGLGGFFLPQLGGVLRSSFHSPFVEALPLAAVAFLAAALQHYAVGRIHRSTPPDAASLAALGSALGHNAAHTDTPAKTEVPR
ncbi:MAG TPA: MFS transporter [Bryobacteraceae bacterium]|nr:MFS transporter [Bryobacteraceae bacterium]